VQIVVKIGVGIVVVCLVLSSCGGEQRPEKNFFEQPLGSRVERQRKYSLPDQYRIFRYGNDEIHPPLMDLAEPIAERGAAAVPFLLDRLREAGNDVTAIRDILLIFETMAASGSYDVKSNKLVMDALQNSIDRAPYGRDFLLGMLQRIQRT
jgi:hypothetical protein